MLGFINKSITKVFGSKSDRDVKVLRPVVEEINREYAALAGLSHDELRNKTVEFKKIIADGLAETDKKISDLKAQADSSDTVDINEKEVLYDQIDTLEATRNEELEVILNEILPKAFAVVKDTARRFTENETISVSATDVDKELAATSDYVEVSGEQADWSNSWAAAGVKMTWGMIHYDVQLIGGMVLHQGKVAEMTTGEGKTLVATLPAYLNAISGRGVHIVTVNDYLAKRDSEWMTPIFAFHGLKTDCIDKHRPNSIARRNAYKADITYGTNNEFGFDYLRDNMAHTPEELVQRKHHFAMVDEVDSVLIDEARTPLIISGPVPRGDEHEFDDLKPRISKLVEGQRALVSEFIISAKKLIAADDDEGGLALFRAHRGLPKNKPLIKFLGEAGNKQLLIKTESIYIAENNRLMPEADEPLFFTIDEKSNSVELTEKGLTILTKGMDDKNFFVLPDLSTDLDKIEKDSSLSLDKKAEQKNQITRDYSLKAQRIHSVNQLLKAYTLFEKDVDYIVVDNQVKIVDEQTGRVMDGRRYSDGLHQALEAKEGAKIEDATQTYATVTLQNYFRMYHKLSGMTGTAETEAGELWEIYELDVIVIPTNRHIGRDDKQDFVFRTVREKFNAVIEETVELTKAGRPVLIGTTSVDISELLSRALKMRNIKHNVLNAKQHAREADVVAEAGESGTVTIATNMAGRGTDIKLTAESKAAGGLAIIGTERHESRRVDRQLRGRAGRQGDPGSSQFYVSLEDNLMRLFGSERIAKVMDRMGFEEGEVIQHKMISNSIERAQKKVEENNFAIRKRLLEYDDVMNSQREVIYKRRRNALFGDRLELDIFTAIFEVCEGIILNYKNSSNYEQFKIDVVGALAFEAQFSEADLSKGHEDALIDKLFEQANKFYEQKNSILINKTKPAFNSIKLQQGGTVKNVRLAFAQGSKQLAVSVDLEKVIETEGKSMISGIHKGAALGIIDEAWKEHLREMDDLKQSVSNARYEQKDPLLIYKFEGFNLFKGLVAKVNQEIVEFLYKCDLPVTAAGDVQQAPEKVAKKAPQVQESKAELGSALQAGATQDTRPQQKTAPVSIQKLPGRNDRVAVQYADGSTKKDVKFKAVEQDVLANKCVLVEE